MFYIWKTLFFVDVQTIIEDLRKEVSPLLKDIRDTGKDIMVTCPFHKEGRESKPSLGISKNEVRRGDKVYPAGTVHCYSCGYVGDLPQFVADVLGLGNAVQGYNWLTSRYIYGAGGGRDFNFNINRESEKQEFINSDIIEEYKRHLYFSIDGREYLAGRKITEEIIEKFNIGYNPERRSITIPVYDRFGNIVMIKERSIEGKRFYNTIGSKKSSAIFGLYQVINEVKANDVKIWICESEIDAMTVWSYGDYGIALMGCEISDEQVKQLSRTNIRTLIDGLDRDNAGRKGARRLKDKLIPKGFRIWNTRWYTDKKDINELSKTEFLNIELY